LWVGKYPSGTLFPCPVAGCWVKYDYVHGIAASVGSESVIAYAPPPPIRLPDIDLAHIRSARGAHLGSSLSEIVALYGGHPFVHRDPHSGRTFVAYLAEVRPCKPAQCATDARFIFDHNAVVSMSISNIGP
jgi:hypothetical protein